MKNSTEILKHRWPEVKTEMQKIWGKLTSDELEKTNGNFKDLAILVGTKYGENEYQFRNTFNDLIKEVESRKI